jgi:succinate dehydrogenase / fumarate reductase cytochrome b subunit
MLNWVVRTLTSSIGKKTLMALTGLALIGFVIVHAAGNMTLYADADGAAFDGYAATLEANPLLPVAEVVLAVLFLAHIALGIAVTVENWRAREGRYRVRATHGGRTWGSGTMIYTGLIVLVFLVVHLIDFRLQKGEGVSFAALVRTELEKPFKAGLYALGTVALGLHLTHAFRSAFQTLGLNHPKYNGLILGVSIGLGVVVGLAFLSFPVVIYLQGGA